MPGGDPTGASEALLLYSRVVYRRLVRAFCHPLLSMPYLCGAFGDSAPSYRGLADDLRALFGHAETHEAAWGWLAASGHRGRRVTASRHGRVLAVYGDRASYAQVERQAGDADPAPGVGPLTDLVPGDLARGNVAMVDRNAGHLLLAADWLSCYPLYYATVDGTLLFSSHLRPLADAIDAPDDPVGVFQFLRQNWCLNGRTLFRGVSRLLAGQVLQQRRQDRHPRISETSALWAEQDENDECDTATVWARLTEACSALPASDTVALMLSGGWDSRVLLAA